MTRPILHRHMAELTADKDMLTVHSPRRLGPLAGDQRACQVSALKPAGRPGAKMSATLTFLSIAIGVFTFAWFLAHLISGAGQ